MWVACLPGACQHALGRTAEAVGDYERVFGMEPGESLGEEARARQFLAFYQRETALYSARQQHADVRSFCLDRDLHPVFKVGCCNSSAYFLPAMPP
jgi:hypothetical protein